MADVVVDVFCNGKTKEGKDGCRVRVMAPLSDFYPLHFNLKFQRSWVSMMCPYCRSCMVFPHFSGIYKKVAHLLDVIQIDPLKSDSL